MKKDGLYRAIKVVIALAALCIAYLFALNGRYDVHHYSYTVCSAYDKWTQKTLLVEKYERVKKEAEPQDHTNF